MSEPVTVPGVCHISDQDIREGDFVGPILASDRVVMPAKHEGATIVRSVEYLLRRGFPAEQILVLVNGATEVNGRPDDTAEKARSVSADLQVLHQGDLLDPELIARLTEVYGIRPERLHGKGTAMFAATLALQRAGIPPDARVIFLDADIENCFEVDPIARLLIGAHHLPTTVKMVKLASLERDNAGIHAFLGTLGGDHAQISALRWPLCGQVVVRWEDLRRMRLASGYAVEMAMMMELIARSQGEPRIFGEVEIGVPLLDRKDSDRVHTRMYWQIMKFAGWVHERFPLTVAQMVEMNRMEPQPIWIPAKKSGEGPNQREMRYPDAILPSIEELFS